MPIIIPVGTGVSVGTGVTTYSGLVTSIGLWLERSDLGTMIPDFITLFEARMNRILRTPEMEVTDDLTIDAERVDLPTDFLQMRALYINGDPRAELEPVSLGTLRTKYALQATGQPECYAISGSELVFGPAPDTDYDAVITYYGKLDPISTDAETNWLISSHPDIYLRGVLLEAEFYGWNDDRLPLLKGAQDEAIDELMAQGRRKQYGAAPLRLRASVRE
jgi:hypothetical protein